ncbi:substrate-binding domain-containing protein [Streptomyces sanglieri]|uniref:substrate-binding domain-containing protein n=1 Tax=Streptomyces sanglieri TaxID=193460 RepID=UPI003525D6F3
MAGDRRLSRPAQPRRPRIRRTRLRLPRLGRRVRRRTAALPGRRRHGPVRALRQGSPIGLTEHARHRGLTVPDDLAVVSYDDEVAAASDPPPTAVRASCGGAGTASAPADW